jgi:hypothetical protein
MAQTVKWIVEKIMEIQDKGSTYLIIARNNKIDDFDISGDKESSTLDLIS